ncbi:MAG: glutamine--fructose-6-phosphate transaminase (isomerizing) [Blastocatellia bacterium]|nr:glutamine--fructose-6-phosphate transaminase (isomerizing) [Blastocatellia bacterium]
MCGIIGYTGTRPAAILLLEGLKRLEYRGYDSAGIAVSDAEGRIQVYRAQGKVDRLEEALRGHQVEGTSGIGHTRWATHGRPSEENAHPHRDCTGRVAVVHNGIIENYLSVRRELEGRGHRFKSETDTEVIVHLVEEELREVPLREAVRRTAERLQGVFALALISAQEPRTIVALRRGAPLVVGLGEGECWVASDIPALLPFTRRMHVLEDGELALLTPQKVQVLDSMGHERPLRVQPILWDPILVERGGYRHFMLKEIHEQPRAVRETMSAYADAASGGIAFGEEIEEAFREAEEIIIVACGTSFHAGLVGKYLLEEAARIRVEAELSSEFRYRRPVLREKTLLLAITQSGETADTLGAVREARQQGVRVFALTNVLGSTITQEVEGVLYTRAGPEIGVAATKTFTTQLVVLVLLALKLGRERGVLSPEKVRQVLEELARLPIWMERVLEREREVETVARRFSAARNALYLGRGLLYPIALEGALKLKELSYIHAEGCAAGEMKHGANALLDEQVPVVVLAAYDRGEELGRVLYEKTFANLLEVRARGAPALAIVQEMDEEALRACREDAEAEVLTVPAASRWVMPLLAILPLQLLAYQIAVRRGCDVDQPRNLAKSVTVE